MRMDDEEGVRKALEEPVRGRRSRGRKEIRWRDKVLRPTSIRTRGCVTLKRCSGKDLP